MSVALALIAGVVLGVLFYGGLWLTIKRLTTTRHPVLLTLFSFWGRTVGTIAGFLLAMNGQWQNALMCLAGFVIGRLVVSVLLRTKGNVCT